MNLLAIILAAGSATASDVALKGGMSLVDGTMITAIFSGISAVIGAIGTILWKNHRDKVKAEIPQPCEVHQTRDCVTVQECNRRMKELDERVTRLEGKFDAGFNRLADQLSEIERKSEERAVSLHRRLDGIVEKLAKTSGEVELIKDKMFKRKKA